MIDGPRWRAFRSAVGTHLLVVPHSRLFDVDAAVVEALVGEDPHAMAMLDDVARGRPGEPGMEVVPEPAPQSISLNVSSGCNLSCSYCYAGRGAFGGAQPSTMTWSTAQAAVDRLLSVSDPTAPVTIGFLGGEPFANRPLLHRVVRYAAARAGVHGRDVRFSVTTNGTLLDASDVALLRGHAFAVTVSVDGGAAIHDRQRPLASGGSSFARLRHALQPLLDDPGLARVAVRATVPRRPLELRARLEGIVELGFAEVGFAPLRVGGAADAAFTAEDWPRYLGEMVDLSRAEITRVLTGGAMRLTNLAIALKQLHRGASSPYPCGAGGGYFSVGADGVWYACHRAIGQETYALGDSAGLDAARRRLFLQERHVHAQTECRSCWARYLCSGGCHQEAATRSPASCDFIRAWLEFCVTTYCELSTWRPDWFTSPAGA